MNVLAKGVDMPENCAECPFCDRAEWAGDDSCPLVAVGTCVTGTFSMEVESGHVRGGESG